jgi:4-hydroxy-tetrahydrodipicolinate synthase
MIQDAPMSSTRLSAAQLAELARDIPSVQYVKVEMPGTAAKLREVIALAGDDLPGPFDGEESVTLLPDLDAGARGAAVRGRHHHQRGHPPAARPAAPAHPRRPARTGPPPRPPRTPLGPLTGVSSG